MSNDDFYKIPEKLDEPEKLAFWTIDEFVVLIGFFALGILLGRFVEGIIGSFAGVMLLKKIKKGRSMHVLKHALYWSAPAALFSFKSTIPSYKRDLAG